MLTGGVQSYGIGSRNLTRYQTDLSNIRAAITDLEKEIEQLENQLSGRASRRAIGVVPRDW
jgi:septal ring factor EnvC (AmiA/AmiB activator)